MNSLLECCYITTGKIDANAAKKDGAYPFYTCASIPERTDSYGFDGDVVLIAGNNAHANFHVNRFTGKFNAYQRTYVLTAKPNFNIDFIYYALKIELNRLKERAQGSQTKFLTIPILKSISLPNYNLNKQEAIASILSALDAKIEINNRINAELEAMAKTLYDYWFVQFDFPDAQGRPYKSSGGKVVWNAALGREVPEGWEVEFFSNWIAKDKSGDWGKESIEGNYTERVYCIRGADINGLNGKGEIKAPERYILAKNSNKVLAPFDIIIEISGGSPTQQTGRIALIIDETLKRFDAPIICSNFCKSVTLKNQTATFNFLFEWNKAYENGILFGFEGKTSGLKNLLYETFINTYKSAVPPSSLMERFFDIIYPLEIMKQKGQKESQHLSALRDWLLPMLMNGQVRVEDPEGAPAT
jgi:type I restriction enzyme S subunit